jgi:signal peptidase I
MEKIKIPRIYIKSFLYLLLIAVFWITLAPKQIGGQYLYIIISGNSMDPFLKNGDLAVVHPTKNYQVNDVILYRNPDLGPVIHRIIAGEGDKYVVKGDHNEWNDSYTPAQAEVYGKLWFHIHSAGKVIEKFRTPVGAAILAGVIGIFLFMPIREKVKQ